MKHDGVDVRPLRRLSVYVGLSRLTQRWDSKGWDSLTITFIIVDYFP